jgi:hypothetical protein
MRSYYILNAEAQNASNFSLKDTFKKVLSTGAKVQKKFIEVTAPVISGVTLGIISPEMAKKFAEKTNPLIQADNRINKPADPEPVITSQEIEQVIGNKNFGDLLTANPNFLKEVQEQAKSDPEILLKLQAQFVQPALQETKQITNQTTSVNTPVVADKKKWLIAGVVLAVVIIVVIIVIKKK